MGFMIPQESETVETRNYMLHKSIFTNVILFCVAYITNPGYV